jgi:frataxin-like iron-binding protein CyaY
MSNRRQFITTLCGATISAGTIPLIGSVSEFNQLEYDKLYSKWHSVIDFTYNSPHFICVPILGNLNKYRCAKEMERFESQLKLVQSDNHHVENIIQTPESKLVGQIVVPTIRRKYSNANSLEYVNSCTFSYDNANHILTIKFKDKDIIISKYEKIADLYPYSGYTAMIHIGNYQKQLKWEEWVHPEESLWTEIEKCLRDCGIL